MAGNVGRLGQPRRDPAAESDHGHQGGSPEEERGQRSDEADPTQRTEVGLEQDEYAGGDAAGDDEQGLRRPGGERRTIRQPDLAGEHDLAGGVADAERQVLARLRGMEHEHACHRITDRGDEATPPQSECGLADEQQHHGGRRGAAGRDMFVERAEALEARPHSKCHGDREQREERDPAVSAAQGGASYPSGESGIRYRGYASHRQIVLRSGS